MAQVRWHVICLLERKETKEAWHSDSHSILFRLLKKIWDVWLEFVFSTFYQKHKSINQNAPTLFSSLLFFFCSDVTSHVSSAQAGNQSFIHSFNYLYICANSPVHICLLASQHNTHASIFLSFLSSSPHFLVFIFSLLFLISSLFKQILFSFISTVDGMDCIYSVSIYLSIYLCFFVKTKGEAMRNGQKHTNYGSTMGSWDQTVWSKQTNKQLKEKTILLFPPFKTIYYI